MRVEHLVDVGQLAGASKVEANLSVEGRIVDTRPHERAVRPVVDL